MFFSSIVGGIPDSRFLERTPSHPAEWFQHLSKNRIQSTNFQKNWAIEMQLW